MPWPLCFADKGTCICQVYGWENYTSNALKATCYRDVVMHTAKMHPLWGLLVYESSNIDKVLTIKQVS